MTAMTTGGPAAIIEPTWKTLQPWEAKFDRQIERLQDEITEIRRHLHAHPEPSGEEVETSKHILRRLAESGIEGRVCRSDAGKPVGVVADLTLGSPRADSPLVAVRADIDALRMPDEKAVPYRSQKNNLAHACGHDAHTAIVLGMARAVVQLEEHDAEAGTTAASFGMRLRLLFQPAEETSLGAQWLVEQGAMQGVAAVLGLHVDPERPLGQVGIRYGILTANCDELDIVVEGHGGHAARPHHTIDPVAASAQLLTALYQNLPRSIDSRHPSVFTVGEVHGGYAANVIPERVVMRGTLRTTEALSREMLKRRLEEIRAGIEQATRTRIRTVWHSPLGAVVNHPQIAAVLESASRRLLGPDDVRLIDHASMGGEDFSVYLEQAPGALLRLGCAVPGTDAPFLHSTRFDLDERALALGARILFRAALLLAARLPA